MRSLVRAELPADVDAEAYVAARAEFLLASPGLAALLPHADLVVFDRPGAVFHERTRLRSLIVEHLTS